MRSLAGQQETVTNGSPLCVSQAEAAIPTAASSEVMRYLRSPTDLCDLDCWLGVVDSLCIKTLEHCQNSGGGLSIIAAILEQAVK